MAWTVLQFGKHKGKTLPQVVLSDPDWFFWAIEKNVFEGKAPLEREAQEINYKARNIKIPNKEGKDLVAEYLIHLPTRRFGAMDIVPRDRPLHQGSSPAFRKDVIELSFPRQISQYDKFGCRKLLLSVKHHLFGDRHCRMTRQRCEGFFEDDSNFVM
ncbi:MAG: hypothetical protein ACFFCW_26605 [Candidatus Hodarchaeota archaeon]